MEGKKRYVALILFLLIGLTLFAFANPVEEEQGSKTGNGKGNDTTEVSDKADSDDTDGTLETEVETETQNQVQVLNQQPADNTYANALAAVEKAEKVLADELANVDSDTVKELLETARDLIDDVTNDNSKAELTERADIVDEALDAIALVEALEELVNDAESKDAIIEAIDYRTDNQVNEVVENLRNEEVKEVLEGILDELNLILDDETAPSYDGIKNNETTKEDVTLTVSDDTEVTVTVTLDGEEIPYTEGETFTKEGVYEVVLVDEAFNETPITFTIDKTAPKFDGLKSGSHYETIEIKVNDATETKITVKNMDTDETTEVANGTVLTEDATYYITAEDAAGNKTSIWVAIDTTAPSITGVDEEKPTNKNEIVYVSDKFLMTVTIDGVKYTREDFTVGENNENFKFQKKVTKEGTHTVIATDKIGNTTTKTFVIDKTAAKKHAVNANVNGYKNDIKEQYATNGNTVTAYISINEELKYNPTFEFYTNGNKILEVAKEDVVASKSSNVNYPYVYTAKLEINESLVAEDGVITFKVVDIVDKAGNQTEDITTMTTGKVITLDRTAAARVYSTVRVNKTEYNEDGTKYYYVKNGDSFEFAMSFTERLAATPTVTIGGRTVEMKLNEKVLENENKYLYEGTFKIAEDEKELTEGTLEIKVSNVKDIAGNESTAETVVNQTKTSNGRTVIYDRTNPVRKSADFYVNGLTQVEKTFYTQYGKSLVVNITTDEILADIPTFTLHNNGNDYKMEGAIYRGLNDKGYHLYQASFDITKESGMTDGEITFTISNITDRAGNSRKDLTEASNGRKVVLDNVLSIDKLAIVGANGQWKDKEYIQYAKVGTTIYVNARFKEELAETPVVTLNDKVTLTKATKKYDEKSKIWIYSYSYKVTADDGLVDGTVQVKVNNIKDFAGNTAELTNANMTMESQSEVVIDKTLPTFRFTKAGSSLAIDEITPIEKDGVFYFGEFVRVTLSDAVNLRLHGVDTYYDDKNPMRTGWLTDVKTTGEHTAVAVDAAGNRLEFKFVIDNEAPVVEASYEEKTVEVDKTGTFTDFPTFKITDNFDKEVKQEQISGEVNLAKLGEYKLVYRFTDLVGNSTDATITIKVVDTTSPIVTANLDENGNKDITLEAGIDTYKELGATVTDNYDDTRQLDKPSYINYYTLDGKYIGRVSVVDTTVLGKYLLVYVTEDTSNNVSNNQLLQSKRWVIVKDTINPTLTVKKESVGTDPYYSSISFALSDSNKIDYFEVNGTKFDRTDAKYSDANYENIKSALVAGENTIVLYDTAGNTTSKTFYMDWTAPTVEVKNWYGQDPYKGADFKLSDNYVIDYFEVNGTKYDRTNAKYSDANYQNIKSSLVNGENTLVLYDAAGNYTTYTFTLERIAPTITPSDGTIGTGPYRKLNLKLYDASGIVSVVINGTQLPHTGTWVDINDGHAYTFQQGTNTVVVTDKAGNTTIESFEIDRNTFYVYTFADLKEAYAAGGTAKVMADIEVTEMLVLKDAKELVLDMNGHKLTINDTTDPMMDIKKGSKITITGNGTFDLEDHKYASLMYPRGEVIIENGNFLRAAGSNKSEYGSFFVGISGSGGAAKIRIYGGYFDGGYYKEGDEFNNSRTMLNASWGQDVKVYGGTFVGQNPAYGDEGMAYTNPNSTSTYCQALFFEGQSRLDTEIPAAYKVTQGTHADGRPTYTVTYTASN